MKIKLVLLLIFPLLISCSKDILFHKSQEKISAELKYIFATDQIVRKYDTKISYKYKLRTFETIADSFYIADGDWRNLKFLNIVPVVVQVDKLPIRTKESYMSEKLQSEADIKIIDSINRTKLYQIIKKYGYPSYDLRKWKNSRLRVGVTAVLTHISPFSAFGKKLYNLMVKEYRKKRVDEGTMRQYLWHIEGRVGEIDRVIEIEEWLHRIQINQKR